MWPKIRTFDYILKLIRVLFEGVVHKRAPVSSKRALSSAISLKIWCLNSRNSCVACYFVNFLTTKVLFGSYDHSWPFSSQLYKICAYVFFLALFKFRFFFSAILPQKSAFDNLKSAILFFLDCTNFTAPTLFIYEWKFKTTEKISWIPLYLLDNDSRYRS